MSRVDLIRDVLSRNESSLAVRDNRNVTVASVVVFDLSLQALSDGSQCRATTYDPSRISEMVNVVFQAKLSVLPDKVRKLLPSFRRRTLQTVDEQYETLLHTCLGAVASPRN